VRPLDVRRPHLPGR